MRVFILLFLAVLITQLSLAQKRLVVAADGSSSFKTIQAAFDAIPLGNKEPVTVFVKKGTYHECVTLDSSKEAVTLIGEDRAKTVVEFNNHVGMITPEGKTVTTPTSATFFIWASNFSAQNITFSNNAGFSAGQAVAVFARGSRLTFYHCNFTGFQDVLYCSGTGSRQYYKDCYIEGTTDFIFGPSTCVFDNCEIHSKKNSYITAASTPAHVLYGFVFMNCKLTADTNVHAVSLGRPWRPYASVAYIRCNMGKHIKPEGWSNWNNTDNAKTARFAECNNSGPGALVHERVLWAKQISAFEAGDYTLKTILSGADNWNPLKQIKRS